MAAPFSALNGADPEALFSGIKSPAYIIDEAQLRRNGEILASVAAHTGAKMLLAQKAFSNYDLYPVLAPYLAGTEASGLFEARLGAEEMPGKEVHVFCTAYRDEDFDELLQYADHIVFNSPRQLEKFGFRAKEAGKCVGLRINPEHSTQSEHEIYNPCAPGSRLGTTRAEWDRCMTSELTALIDGLHFHTLCEQNADALAETIDAVERGFGDVLSQVSWVNFGGGHHITRDDYDLPLLEKCISDFRKRWNTEIYLEPGEAWALNAGYLVTRVLDLPQNGETKLAILDMSAACHTPDVLEMPYRPPLYGSGGKYIYRLGGPTCLSGDIIGDYGFDAPLSEGRLLTFGDMAIYTTCKNNTFNGMPLPNIWVLHTDGTLEQLTDFGYSDFRSRLGRPRK
ncbi:MAG: carboxynorspermidine decarboxylase [Synergistes sp.]|nr:carboxynorspermidine decarboxylase [Synergistes sp.]